MSLMDRAMTRLMCVQTSDFRDWAAIRVWAQTSGSVENRIMRIQRHVRVIFL
ncbi:MAG: hypothetical protein LUQ40_05025 [Methanomicrobiales archaeon]|nr:hypothetical protein [Methanomicrobiales archaeon]